ncbi:hypothetical protein BDP27DRAFT_1447443 [Rhodocollybia butyracea]|uniref:Sfi1 spindle body domain-containing protein n=1 Tax=Rhodocollybia butyracea TaxID=206335 RepID=A0A9P5U8I1_9AGAR|nr:hypothetical protein BDP27DRAFT_1447443 [Rhodocollybia butyracea]
MFGFRPVRSSSPAKSIAHPQQRLQLSTNQGDVSRSSTFSTVPELAGLAAEDVQLIDEIIERAGPTATTFLTIFKAYNDILLERGLDPHEVVYYGKLLKLGTLKGSSWKEKWDAIKHQNGYRTELQSAVVKSTATFIPKKQPSQPGIVVNSRPGPSIITNDDLFSSLSALHNSLTSETDDGSELPAYHASSRRPLDLTNNSLGLEEEEGISQSFPTFTAQALPRRLPRPWEPDMSEHVASTPPSYRVVTRNLPARSHSPDPLTRKFERLVGMKPTALVAKPPKKRDSAINEEEAWKKVKMLQDEREADRFREEKLVEHFYDLWKQEFQWIITTNKEVLHAREHFVLRTVIHCWHQRTTSRRALYERVDVFADRRCQRSFFSIWKQRIKQRIKQKQQAEWRQDMRMKIQIIRQKRDRRMVKEAWVNWEFSHKLLMAERYYDGQLAVRYLQHWKTKLREFRESEAIADVFRNRMDRVFESYWDHWRLTTDLARTEKVVADRVGLRMIGEALDTWKKKTQDVHIADSFYSQILSKNTIKSWGAARDRIRYLDIRVNKHLGRQDDILLRAVMRVWKAHERGKLLEKVKAFRLIKTTWVAWNVHVHNQRKLEDQALHFSTRLNSSSARLAMFSWRQAITTHQNIKLIAIHHHSSQVLRCALLRWRLQLHHQLKMAKKARRLVLEKSWMALTKSWDAWKNNYRERLADRKMPFFEQAKAKKIFNAWSQRTRKLLQQRLADEIIQEQVRKRILSTMLTHWTNRVIEIKVEELEVTQRNEAALLITAFKKWKRIRVRHVEELALMQSYQDIKREENVRRIFNTWLTATRTTRNRRAILREKEEEIKQMTVAVAWDRWREQFQEVQLRPKEHQFLLQNKEAHKYRAFATWFSKTQSLPAIHFDSKRIKAKSWKVWMRAMPRALQSKTAREVNKVTVLKKSLARWLQVYRTKLSLKAVARARYFPAPSAPSRLAVVSRPIIPLLSYAPRNHASRTNFPRRAIRSDSPDEEEAALNEPSSISRFASLETRIAAPVPTKARSEASPTRTLISAPITRASSPARSTKSVVPTPWYLRSHSPVMSPVPSSVDALEERSSLWQDLRDLRKLSGPSSERSRPSRKPL